MSKRGVWALILTHFTLSQVSLTVGGNPNIRTPTPSLENIGEMKLEVVNMKHELGEMGESIEDDKKMLAELMLASKLSIPFHKRASGLRG